MKGLVLALAAAACSATPPPRTEVAPVTPARDAPRTPVATAPVEPPPVEPPPVEPPPPVLIEVGADRFGPLDATTPLDLVALRARLPGFSVDEVVRDAAWARYRAFAVRDAGGALFDVIPGERGRMMIALQALDRLAPDALREERFADPRPRCVRAARYPGQRHCPSALANLRWVKSEVWTAHEISSDDDYSIDQALWWPATGEPPETFTPLVTTGLAPSRVVAMLARDGLAQQVGKAGVAVVRAVGDDDPRVETFAHGCGRDVRKVLAASQADLEPAVHAAIGFLGLAPRPTDPDDPHSPMQPAGIQCAATPTPRCLIHPTSEGDPAFELRFADATPTAPLTAVIERDDWQSQPEYRAALDAKIARTLAAHRCR